MLSSIGRPDRANTGSGDPYRAQLSGKQYTKIYAKKGKEKGKINIK
jgi:hypothetical protein